MFAHLQWTRFICFEEKLNIVKRQREREWETESRRRGRFLFVSLQTHLFTWESKTQTHVKLGWGIAIWYSNYRLNETLCGDDTALVFAVGTEGFVLSIYTRRVPVAVWVINSKWQWCPRSQFYSDFVLWIQNRERVSLKLAASLHSRHHPPTPHCKGFDSYVHKDRKLSEQPEQSSGFIEPAGCIRTAH